ncbi:MAG: cation:proton antiporter [Planctomycetota bacterium]
MKFVLALLVLTILALAGSRRVLFARRVPLGARLIFLTGTEFIVVGFLLGDSYLGLIDEKALLGLEPFAGVCLGWVGLLFGLQFEHRSLRTVPPSFLSASLFQSIFTWGALFAVFLVLARASGEALEGELVAAAATLAAAGACTGQAGLAMIQRNFPNRGGQTLSLLRYIASLDPVPAILLFGGATALFLPGRGMIEGLGGGGRLLLGVSIALLMGWLLVSLAWGKTSNPELLLIAAGTCAVASGLAVKLGISILFVCTICGAIVANVSTIRQRLTEFLARGEHFLYIVLLIFAGASLHIPSIGSLVLVAVYVTARLAAKLVGTYLATRPLARHVPVPPWVGLGLTAQAGMALAIAIDFHHGVSGTLGNLVLTVVLLGLMVTELAGPALTLVVLRSSAESPGRAP